MASVLNEGEDDSPGGISSYLSGGMEGEHKKVRKVSMKQQIFKLVNLLTFQNVITNTMYIILLICEFTQFLGFVMYKLELAQTTTSQFGIVTVNSTSIASQNQTASARHVSLAYISYLNIKQLLMEVRGSVTVESSGQLTSFVIAGLAVFVIFINIVIIIVLCKLSKDGYDALFASQGMKMMLKICGVAQQVINKILFVPLMIILISIPICSKDYSLTKPNDTSGSLPASSDVLRSYYYGGYECWNISHIILTAICLLFALAQAALSCLISILFNDIRFHSSLPWGSASTKAELIKTLIKILIAIALNIEMYDRWALLVCQCANVILVYLLLHSRWKFFYHSDRKVLISTVILEAAYLWLSFAVTLINAAQLITLSYSLFVYIIISSLAFAILILVAFLNSKDSHRMLFHLPHLRSDYEFEQFFLRLQRHVADNKANNIDKIVIYGLLKDHQRNQQQRCTDPKCHCEQLFYLMSRNKLELHLQQLHEMSIERQHLLQRNDPKHNFDKVQNTKRDLDTKQVKKYEYKFRRLFFKFFYSLLSKRIDQQFPKSMRLKYLQVQVLQHELSNEFKSYFQVLKLLKDKPSLEYQYFLYQAKQSVEHIMYRKYQSLLTNKQTIDVVKVYDFEELFIRFEKQIVNTANNCLNFWKELMDKRLDVNRIHDFGVQISTSYSEVNEITQSMVKLFPHHVQFQRIFAAFLGDVMNNENEAYEINQKVRAYLESSNNMHKLNYMNEDKFFGYNTGTVIITITVTPRDIGNIVNVNFEAKKLLGYRHKELKGKNVRILMPKILTDNHDSFLQNYFETAKAKILEQQRVVIAKDKDGYIIPSYILVKAIPNLKRNLTFVGFLRRLDETHAFMQPPTQYSSLDYHFVVTDTEGQIYGFSKNCWETFGFKPAFFFNQFGDPEQQIRMELIVKNLKDPAFLNKVELKREGIFCSLDTGVVMENAPRELLSKEEQDLMLNISGQYNINIQLEEMSFSNGKINLRIYKIIKLSRIIRSKNAFDEIGATNNLAHVSFESQEIDSQYGELTPFGQANTIDKKKTSLLVLKKRENSEMFEDAKQDDTDYAINPNDINLSMQNNSYAALNDRNGKGFDSSNEDSASSGANHSQSQQLVNFKKQISTKEMPQSIIKLNRLVLCIVIVILSVVVFDTIQNYEYYKFSQTSQQILQNLYHKHYLISKISANAITMGLINMGLQSDNYQSFTNRRVTLRQKLLKDIETLESMEESIQNSPDSTNYGIYGLSQQFNQNPSMLMTLLNQDSSFLQDPSQTMRYAVSQLIGKVASLLQQNSSFSQIYLPPELSTINEKLFTQHSSTRNETAKSLFFIVYNSLRDLTTNTLEQMESFHEVAFKKAEELNHWLLVSAFIFFCVFVVMSGFVIFPIVVGVQRNKVMILSIYFDLPMEEIKAVHQRCFQFLCKIDDERRNEALMMQAQDDNHEGADGQKIDDSAVGHEIDESQDHSVFTKREGNTNRKLVQKSQVNRKKKGTKTQFKKPQMSPTFNKSAKQEDHEDEEGSDNHQDGAEDKGENGEADDASLDHNKMLKDIKVSNNKLNMVTLGVILIFLTYFSTCFGISLNYLSQIDTYVTTQTKLYAEQPALEYTYLYFLTDILLDDTETTIYENERYSKKVDQVYKLLDSREEAKRSGVDWLKKVDNQTFCESINDFIDTPFEKSQCNSILDGQFRLGYRSSVFSFMYQFQQLRVRYDLLRKNQTKEALRQKLNMLNDPEFIKFSVISNAYYQSQMHGLNNSLTDVLATFFDQCILFVQLRIVFFVLFAFIIFAFLWRIFLKNIQAEVFRSKGMLNMIPTAFLEKDNNLRKLSLNKLVNLG